ncbi:MAG: GGDEF domain-containing protein [Pseudomonadota bacterium]
MKITRTNSTGRARPVSSGPSKVSGASETTPVDRIEFAGIPENELTPLVRKALMDLMQEVASLRAELSRTQSQIKELAALAESDPLTGILNRRGFVAELTRALAFAARHDQRSSLAFIDVNKMKSINDQWGHSAGDAALCHIAEIVTDNIRATDVLARIGGDEFAMILSYTNGDVARSKLTRLSDQIEKKSFHHEGQDIFVTISWGVTEITSALSADDLLRSADREMYSQKAKPE